MVFLFSSALFLSAALLFSIQPLVGKAVLPALGGTPAIWNTCMFFFQAILLAGYLFAHLSTNRLKSRVQPLVQILMMAAMVFLLPRMVIGETGIVTTPNSNESPVLWLLVYLTVTVGGPVFALASLTPVLQHWFSATRHSWAKSPYFLYAASNLGSFGGLLSYPLLIEPRFTLAEQSRIWSKGYLVLLLLTAIVAFALRRENSKTSETPEACTPETSPSRNQYLTWIVLAFIPSSLMLAVTTHITTNIAALPLLWVIPLALYLLSFVLVFSRKCVLPHNLVVRLSPFVVLPLAPILFVELRYSAWLILPLHLLLFFVVALLIHGELAAKRPSARFLTQFYLALAVGGVLGGFFNSILSPFIFKSVLEYPLVLGLALFFQPGWDKIQASFKKDVLPAFLLLFFTFLLFELVETLGWDKSRLTLTLLFGLPAFICFTFRPRPFRFGLASLALFCALGLYRDNSLGTILAQNRNFFGIKIVVLDPDSSFRRLVHNGTYHGIQSNDPARACEPLAYYHRSGPVGDIFSVLYEHAPKATVGILGLGIGGLAAYNREGGSPFVFYEIDPAVVKIAEDPNLFTFLEKCSKNHAIVLGDARLSLTKELQRRYQLMVLDVFNSDSIPIHLLTREAVKLYLSRLEKDGLLAFNISNRFLNLEPLVANLGDDLKLFGVKRFDFVLTEEDRKNGKLPSQYIVLAKDRAILDKFMKYPGWERLRAKHERPVWTDQYSDVVSYLSF